MSQTMIAGQIAWPANLDELIKQMYFEVADPIVCPEGEFREMRAEIQKTYGNEEFCRAFFDRMQRARLLQLNYLLNDIFLAVH